MDDATINDLGYVWGRIIYDDSTQDDGLMRKNRVKIAATRMGKLAAEHIDEPIEYVMNYDY